MSPPAPRPTTLRARAGRLPLRARLVAGFVVAMTVVLTAAGSFVYWRVQIALDAGLDRDLTDQMADLRTTLDRNGGLLPDQAGAARRDQQLTDGDGRVVAASPGLGSRPLLSPADAALASRRMVRRDVGRILPASRQPLRLLAGPAPAGGPNAVLIVAVSRDQRDEALRELLGQLAVAGFGALAVAALVGERLAKAALAPVERYRAQAERIAGGASGVRLDVPAGRDDEVTRLGHTFNRVLGALERAVEHERHFAHAASHELRTPLTLLSARVQLLRSRPRTAEAYQDALAEVETDIRSLVTLAAQLLETGAAADAPVSPDERNSRSDLAEVASTVATAHRGSPARWVGSASAADVAVPRSHLRQMLDNLVANAHRHGRPPVEVTVHRLDHAVVVTVTDHGPPLDPGFLPLAFERFHRSDDARARPGSGLGLALVAALVERHHGELRLCSAGTHHRRTDRLSFACRHPEAGTTATVAFRTLAPVIDDIESAGSATPPRG